MPAFSVVIPTYNRSVSLLTTVQSFLGQSSRDFELIIVDDGGNDNTKEELARMNDDRIRYFWKENAERGAARNFGARQSKGIYVTFFDSDDFAYPFFLENAQRQLLALGRPEFFAQKFEIRPSIPVQGDWPGDEVYKPEKHNDRLSRENFLACNGVFVRNDVLDRFAFSEDRSLSGSEDWYLWLQLASTYPLWYDRRTCSCLINHTGRGELNIKKAETKQRIRSLIMSVSGDPGIRAQGRSWFAAVKGSVFLFAANKTGYFTALKGRSLLYLLRAIAAQPPLVSRREFWIAIKIMLTQWR